MSLSLLIINSWLSKTMRWTGEGRNINDVREHVNYYQAQLHKNNEEEKLGGKYSFTYN